MSERRLSKRQLKEDPFLDAVQSALAYARDNIVVVVLGGLLFVAAVVLAVRVGESVTGGRPRGGNPEAERALADAREEFALGRMDEGVVALDAVRAEHGGSEAAREATFVLGNAYFEQGKWAEAEKAFQEFLNKPLYDGLMKDAARLGIAACREESGDLAGAQAAYLDVFNTGANPGTMIEGALGAARCAHLQGQDAEAQRLYQAVVDRYPDAPEAETAQFELLELEG